MVKCQSSVSGEKPGGMTQTDLSRAWQREETFLFSIMASSQMTEKVTLLNLIKPFFLLTDKSNGSVGKD